MPAMEYYGTLGPACASVDCLAEMFEAGMTGMRLNLSHVTLKGASAQLAAFHEAAGRVGVAAKLLVDLQGPELRVGSMEMPVELTEGSLRVRPGGAGRYAAGAQKHCAAGRAGPAPTGFDRG